jgi:hypothetical protein
MMETLTEYWYIIGFGLLLIGYYIYSMRKPNSNINSDSTKFYFTIGIIFMGALLIQKWFFSEHWFYWIAMLIFIPLWAIIIKYLLSRDDVYVLESAIIGDEFYDISIVNKIVVDNTTQRILIMPREIYESKKHIGDLHYGFWAGANRIKFTDYYDDKNGIFYHPPIQQLHNFTFYAIKGFWLKMKKDLPNIIDENTKHTLLFDWHLAFKMDSIKTNIDEHLKAMNVQHENAPFEMPDSLETMYKKALKDKLRDIDKTESRTKPESEKTESKPESDSKPGGDVK